MIKITTKGNKSWVTFSIIPNEGESVEICGEWSEWENEPLKTKKSGEMYITKILNCDKEYQFGYRVNGTEWRCDDEAECVPSPYGTQNSVIKL